MYLHPTTWHLLGLSVAATYTALGVFQCTMPRQAAQLLFGVGGHHPKKRDEDQDSKIVPLLVPLLGARDLTIAAGLFTFASQGKNRDMGTMILAGTILCIADVAAIFKAKGKAFGWFFTFGALFWTGIGLGLQFDGL
ncbi:hypothetical protein ACHAQA_004605 [Verticillium albo-atrum]